MNYSEEDFLKIISQNNIKELYEFSILGDNLFSYALSNQKDKILRSLIDKGWEISLSPKGTRDTENFLSITHHIGDFTNHNRKIKILILEFISKFNIPTYFLSSIMGLNYFCQEIFFHDPELYRIWIKLELNHSKDFIFSLGEVNVVQPQVLLDHIRDKETDFIQEIFDSEKTQYLYKTHLHRILSERNKREFLKKLK